MNQSNQDHTTGISGRYAFALFELIQEEKDSKTNNVTEELVLYMFLGVFVIFIVDSFARVSKYKR